MNSVASNPYPQTLRDSLWLAALFTIGVLLIYLDTTLSMVSIWSRSDTFAHGFLILPISLWLIWNRREYLPAFSPRPVPWVALLLLPAGFGWLLAWLVDVALVQQLGLIAILIIGVWAILGHRLTWAIAFPLFFLFFAVPMGESLISPMMDFTAFSTVWLVQQSGIPVYREGLYFSLPTGRWSVVEACSGVRYIIASVTVGALFAYLTYVSWWRRALFLVISAIVPVFANSLRAYMIVMLGHFSDMTVATGADHLVYGWVFFGIVIFILFWLGSFFREDELPPKPAASTDSAGTGRSTGRTALIASLVGVLLLASVAPLATRWVSQNYHIDESAIVMPSPADGWIADASTSQDWQSASRVGGVARQQFVRGDDIVVLELQFSDGSFDLGEVIGSSRLFALQDGPWSVIERDKPTIFSAVEDVAVDEALVRGPQGQVVVWSWYVLGTLQTSNDYVGKVYQAASSFGLLPKGVVRVVLFTSHDETAALERERLQSFLDANGKALIASLRQATGAIP